jgi:predicted transcriptional regulator
VTVSYRDLTTQFSGDPASVFESISRFIQKEIPSLSLASEMVLNYSLADLVRTFKTVIKLTPEGPRVWAEGSQLSDKETIALNLVATRIAMEAGSVSTPCMTLADLKSATNLNPKSLSSRLSELTQAGYVQKESSGKGVCYKITTTGINWISSSLNK